MLHHLPRGGRASFSSFRGWIQALALLACALLATGCATQKPRQARAYTPPTVASGETIFGPSVLTPEQELEALGRNRTTPAMLRRAWLELQLRHPQSALDAAAEVLFGSSKPSTSDAAIARYLRAEAYLQQGMPERGRFDHEQALALAVDPLLVRRLQAMALTPAEAPPAMDAGIAILPRTTWNARAPNRGNMDAMGKVTRVTIHHSAILLRDDRQSACSAQLQRIQRDHMGARGYGDIGYHFLIDPSGRIWQGRDLRWQGAHAKGEHNVGNVGICLLGNFMPGKDGQKPNQEQLQAMERLVVHLLGRFGLQGDDLFCHSHFRNTECPGPLVEPVVARLQRTLQQRSPRVAAAE